MILQIIWLDRENDIKRERDISVSYSLLYIMEFYLISIVPIGGLFDLAVCSMFQCTCWRLSCIFIDYSEVISLVWTTYGFYLCIEEFSTLNKSYLYFL